MIGLKLVAGVGLLSGASVVAQVVPSVPKDFSTWPGEAIMGLITLASLVFAFTVVLKIFGVLDSVASKLSELCEVGRESNEKMDTLISKLDRRPCISSKE